MPCNCTCGEQFSELKKMVSVLDDKIGKVYKCLKQTRVADVVGTLSTSTAPTVLNEGEDNVKYISVSIVPNHLFAVCILHWGGEGLWMGWGRLGWVGGRLGGWGSLGGGSWRLVSIQKR